MSRISQFLVHIFSSFACPGVKKKKNSGKNSSLKDSSSTGEIFFPQMLCLVREPKKTEHVGKKNFPSGSRDFDSRDPLGKFFPPDALFF